MPWDIHPHYHVRDKSQVQGLFKGNKTILKSWFNKCTGWILSTHNKKSKWKAGHNPLLILLFSLFRNGTGNDASIIPLEIRLAIKGLLILLIEQPLPAWTKFDSHINKLPTGWWPSLTFFILITMVTVVHSTLYIFLHCGYNLLLTVIIREGHGGTLPTEMQKVNLDNASYWTEFQ